MNRIGILWACRPSTVSSPPGISRRGSVRAQPVPPCHRALLSGFASVLLLVAAAPALAVPDLVVEKLLVSPNSGRNGTAVQITATIKNQGNTSADESVTRIRINQDPTTVGGGDIALCSSLSTPTLAAGASVDVGCTPTLSGRPGGANYIWAIADVNNTTGQDNEDNDRASTLFTVDTDAPDLIVQSVAVSPATAANGETLTITVNIKNQGTGLALSSVTRIRINQDPASVDSGDLQICNIPTGTIAVGATVQVQCPPVLSGRPAGTNYIWVIADVNNTAGQMDRTNDRGSTSLVVKEAASDLIVESVVVSPTGGPNGKQVSVTAVIKNQGTAASFPSVTRVRINQDSTTVGGDDLQICDTIQTASIPVGGSVEIQCKPTPTDRPAGPNFIWVVADSTNSAGQSDRENDRGYAEFVVDPPPTPDLAVTSISVTPLSSSNGGTITITARVANQGEINSPTTKTRFVIGRSAETISEDDPILCDQVNTVALSPGSYINLKCKPVLAGLASGDYFLWAVVDITEVSTDENPDNDALATPFTVLAEPAPDLVVESVTANPPSAASTSAIAITATIRNQGNLAAAASVTRFRFSDSSEQPLESDPVLCDAVATPALAAGAAVEVQCPWVVGLMAPITYYLWATADVTDTSGQFERDNDSRHTAFNVLPSDGPDLVIKRLVTRPRSGRNGQTIVAKARVANVGNLPANPSVTTFRINLSATDVGPGDDVLCAGVATPRLLPGAGVRVACKTTLEARPIGVQSIWAIADTTATSGQFNPDNDRRRRAFTVSDVSCTNPLVAPVLRWPIEQPKVIQDYASYGSVPLANDQLGYHSGVDLVSHLPLPADQLPVYAAADGEVVASRRSCPSPAVVTAKRPDGKCAAGWGNYVIIRHGAGIYTIYAHLDTVLVGSGCIPQGTRIGVAGSSGWSTIPPHLHFGVVAKPEIPVGLTSLGNEYYLKYHPLVGRRPETPSGSPRIHLDPRDFMVHTRVRVLQSTQGSRGRVSGGEPVYLGIGQEYVSLGELVPGYHCLELPNASLPEDGPPYADNMRYAWVPRSAVTELEAGFSPSSLRIDGYKAFLLQGIEANFATLRDQPSDSSAEVSKTWGGQQFAPTGGLETEGGTGIVWLGVDVPGSSALGAGGPREAWLPSDLLGPAPAP